ncbi:hypothetical protein ASG39_02040 [Rhizobium sp. Leaf371]|nr:hypothetical protein ASG39_02040 [Rhizobium sp. Leaf371]
MSISVTSEPSQRRSNRPILAILASLALHAAIIAPFVLRLPDRAAEEPVEQSVTVEIVPEPEKTPEPVEKPETTTEKAPEPRPEAPKPQSAPSKPPPPPTPPAPASTSTPAEPSSAAAPSQPFEASAAEETDAPREAVDLPAPDDKALKEDVPTQEPAEDVPASSADAADKPYAKPASSSDAPVSETRPDAPTPAPTPPQPAETPPAMPEVLTGKTPLTEGEESEAATLASPPSSIPPPETAPPPPLSSAEKPDVRPTTESRAEAPMTPDEQAAFVPAKPAVPVTKPDPEPAPKAAKTLYARNILADPRVRGALGRLSPEKRIVQICGIEALEQARHSSASFRPDLLKGFGKNGGLIAGPHLSARGGAVRSRGVWREITFDCTVNAAFDAITSFRFAIGDTIPRSDWAARGLAAD